MLEDAEDLLTTGEFARQARLTAKAVRLYDRLGLLCPVVINETTSYRYYHVAQVRTGQLIGLLRGADLSLADISLVLGDAAQDAEAAVRRLESLLDQIDRRHAGRRLLIRHVQTIFRQGADAMFSIAIRNVPARRVMSIQRRLHAAETDGFVREAKAAFAERLDGTRPTGPLTLIFHGVVDEDEHDGPLEATMGCPGDILPDEIVGVRTEPAHEEAYTTITKAQWAYPAILAAYDAVACSSEVRSRSGSRLSCREVYLAEPDAIGPEDLVCDVAYPLADR